LMSLSLTQQITRVKLNQKVRMHTKHPA